MPAKGRGRHPLRSTWLGRGRGRGLVSPVGKQILPSGAARVGHEVYADWFFPETELKLYLRNTTTNGISIGGVACYDLLTTAGASADTAVVNTTASGTEIQFTKTAGGSVAAFITGRVPSGGWTITSSDVALWLQESAATVNAGLRYRLFKYSGGTETELGGSPFDAGTEFNTGSTLTTLVGNVTDTALEENDRLLLRVYAVNIGTMGAGTATLGFNGAVGGTTGQITAYPDPANGNPRFAFGTSTSWAACRSNATSDPVEYPSNEVVFQGELVGATYVISRIGYVFDTSSIPDNATITSATFSVYSTTTGDGSETTNPANGALVEYTPSSDTAPTTSDYQQFGTTRLADADVTRASFVASSAYKDWVLNATGLAAINKTGNTRLGIRPSNDFSDATAPTARSYALGYYAAQAGTANDPMLVVNYSTYSFADSYINVYPAVTFKAEDSGVTGSGATSQAQTSDGAGSFTLAPVTGTGNTSQAQTSAGSGTHSPAAITATGSTSQAQTSDGTGTHSLGVDGVGSTSQTQTASGSGSFTLASVDGSGSTSQAQTSAGSGTHTVGAVTGTGNTSQAQTSSGSGTHSPQAVTGDGTTSQAQTSDGSGLFTAAGIVNGTGSTSQAQSANGTGSHTPPVSQVSIVYGGDDAPKRKKHSKKETPYRDEIERLFNEAEQVYQPAQESTPQAQEIVIAPIEIKKISYDVEYLQSIIVELVNLRDNMNGDELEKLYVMRQEFDKRRMFMIRARAALLL